MKTKEQRINEILNEYQEKKVSYWKECQKKIKEIENEKN
jgi:hypothetical protein